MPNNLQTKRKELEVLLACVTENKRGKFEQNIQFRTRHITVVLEDIYQSQNASAVLRTCDCFGIQDVHIIENRNIYKINPQVELGATKWLNLIKYNTQDFNTIEAYNSLKKQGYTIVATTPHKNDCLLHELPLDKKIALVFGTELEGLSPQAIEHADAYVKIPMYGFTESFNISVSAAICLHTLTEKMRASQNNWQLTEAEKIDVLISWAQKMLTKPKR